MPTTLELIGKAVVERGDGRLGQVKDVIIDPAEVKVLALLVRPAPPAADDLVLPFESVFELRSAEVVVTARDDLAPIGRLPRVRFAHKHGPHLGRTPLVSSDGVPLGVIHDLHYDPDSTRVAGYEVASSDAPTRLVYVPAEHASFQGDEALHVSARADVFFAHMARASPGDLG
ncbi:hypothetical protein DAETH_41250 (plasmid) [Deinococcus aetherius]|uniref:PRC-barrel domain-containing protein n=1 Tax=Deinococcus aetherius TaxID=200252 RepID=A0ABM8AK13_9DEIO|nr:PRC-barrel domain-containing protein [Deinococcus aetherius]BDP44156.1 hypothetical protein DAETH_41250 [Deinococcus aetherius]